jgi:hypothetical protein
MGTWKVVRLGEDQMLGVVGDINEKWHAVIITRRWRLTHILEPDEAQAEHTAYLALSRILDLDGKESLLPEEDRLKWREEATPSWVLMDLQGPPFTTEISCG